MDRIVVKTNADMQRVLDWSEELRGMAVELPFPEGEIEFSEELILLKFRDVGAQLVEFEMWVRGDVYRKVVGWRSDLSSGVVQELHIAGDVQSKSALGSLLLQDNTIGKCVAKFRGLMLFAAYYREDIARTKTWEWTDRPARKGGKGKNRRPLVTRKYVVSEEMLRELPAPKKGWHGYRESFGVRGHFRRYKSGKIVWIRPYEKKGREEKRGDREYIL
jgi:hypothetical protein